MDTTTTPAAATTTTIINPTDTEGDEIALTDEQLRAVELARAGCNVMLLGDPFSGKKTTVDAIIEMFMEPTINRKTVVLGTSPRICQHYGLWEVLPEWSEKNSSDPKTNRRLCMVDALVIFMDTTSASNAEPDSLLTLLDINARAARAVDKTGARDPTMQSRPFGGIQIILVTCPAYYGTNFAITLNKLIDNEEDEETTDGSATKTDTKFTKFGFRASNVIYLPGSFVHGPSEREYLQNVMFDPDNTYKVNPAQSKPRRLAFLQLDSSNGMTNHQATTLMDRTCTKQVTLQCYDMESSFEAKNSLETNTKKKKKVVIVEPSQAFIHRIAAATDVRTRLYAFRGMRFTLTDDLDEANGFVRGTVVTVVGFCTKSNGRARLPVVAHKQETIDMLMDEANHKPTSNIISEMRKFVRLSTMGMGARHILNKPARPNPTVTKSSESSSKMVDTDLPDSMWVRNPDCRLLELCEIAVTTPEWVITLKQLPVVPTDVLVVPCKDPLPQGLEFVCTPSVCNAMSIHYALSRFKVPSEVVVGKMFNIRKCGKDRSQEQELNELLTGLSTQQ